MYHILRGVDALHVVYYTELKLPIWFTVGIHCYLRGVDKRLLCSLKRQSCKNLPIYGCAVLPKKINLNDLKKGLLLVCMSTPRSHLLRESIFEYEYLCAYEAKIENTLTLV